MKHYEFYLEYTGPLGVTEYASVSDQDVEEYGEPDEGVFDELIGDDYPGMIVTGYKEIDVIPTGVRPFVVG